MKSKRLEGYLLGQGQGQGQGRVGARAGARARARLLIGEAAAPLMKIFIIIVHQVFSQLLKNDINH